MSQAKRGSDHRDLLPIFFELTNAMNGLLKEGNYKDAAILGQILSGILEDNAGLGTPGEDDEVRTSRLLDQLDPATRAGLHAPQFVEYMFG